jgi:hypothetical protein
MTATPSEQAFGHLGTSSRRGRCASSTPNRSPAAALPLICAFTAAYRGCALICPPYAPATPWSAQSGLASLWPRAAWTTIPTAPSSTPADA